MPPTSGSSARVARVVHGRNWPAIPIERHGVRHAPGFASVRSEHIDNNTFEMVRAGLHLSFRMSVCNQQLGSSQV